MKTTTIVLGGATYDIEPLPIGVLRELDQTIAETPLDTLSKKDRETFFFDQALTVIFHGLKTKYPAMDMNKLKAIPSDMQEFFKAREMVLRHSGLLIDKEVKSGEGEAAAS
jgi:hypothetical protein